MNTCQLLVCRSQLSTESYSLGLLLFAAGCSHGEGDAEVALQLLLELPSMQDAADMTPMLSGTSATAICSESNCGRDFVY